MKKAPNINFINTGLPLNRPDFFTIMTRSVLRPQIFNIMTKYLMIGLLLALFSTGFFIYQQNQVTPPPMIHTAVPTTPIVMDGNNNIQVALLLDTSNSMDGLIEQAKSQLWKMVNELASATKNGEAASIQIALYQYGNDNLSISSGYIEQVLPMTTDLDAVSDKLFKLKTKGGSEYCPWAITDAAQELTWSGQSDDLKMIIIAGNEDFAQGPVSVQEACKAAEAKGIIVNPIFCGDYKQGINVGWKEISDCTPGKYLNIDQDEQVVHVATPYDDKVLELNERMNNTYIGYGNYGVSKRENQQIQDSNAGSYSAANMRSRAFFKSKKAYKNSDWDLVDKSEESEKVLEEIDPEALPDNMQKMDMEERKQYLESKKEERATIQKELYEYEKKVRDYITEQQKESVETQTLDKVLIGAMRQQAEEKRFKFE